ncbi:MAG: hypothetical protein KGJ37_01205 [Verrucomicrobiota bacterium]|nr:hypothetical protein [Verrucomicrobiota bacterium]
MRCCLAATVAIFFPALARALPTAQSAEGVQPITLTYAPEWLRQLDTFVDRMPATVERSLPELRPHGYYQIWLRPRLNHDFFRLPFGGEYKINNHVEISGELQNYLATGLSDATGYGFSGADINFKYEQQIRPSVGLSAGLNFHTPLSRPPLQLTDGYRHTQPYVATTFPLAPRWKLIGYAAFSLDMLNHTALPSNFGANELHANSMGLSVGAGRDWKHFHTSLTASLSSSVLMSDEGRQVFALRPEMVVPFRVRPKSGVIIFWTLGTYAVWGPDGRQLGAGSSVRVEFRNRAHR